MDLPEPEQINPEQIPFLAPDSQGMLLQLNSDDIIISIKEFLEGKIKDSQGREISKGKALVSDELKHSLLSALNMSINRTIVLSDLEEPDVMNMSMDISIAVLELLTMNSEKIHTDPDVIRVGIENIIYATFRRALKGKERETARTQMQDVQQTIRQDSGKKKKQESENWLYQRS